MNTKEAKTHLEQLRSMTGGSKVFAYITFPQNIYIIDINFSMLTYHNEKKNNLETLSKTVASFSILIIIKQLCAFRVICSAVVLGIKIQMASEPADHLSVPAP